MADANFDDVVLLIDVSDKGVGEDANWDDVVLLIDASAAVEVDPTVENLQATPTSPNAIEVTWDQFLDDATPADGYEIEIDSGTPIDVGDVQEYTDDELDPLTTRAYRVRAYFTNGTTEYTEWSASVEATTLANRRVPALEFFGWQERILSIESDPPGSPDKGDRYLIEAAATGDWAGHEDSIAWWDGDNWRIDGPFNGWLVYNLDNSTVYLYHVGWNPMLVAGFGGGVVAVSPDGGEVRLIGIDNTGSVEARTL